MGMVDWDTCGAQIKYPSLFLEIVWYWCVTQIPSLLPSSLEFLAVGIPYEVVIAYLTWRYIGHAII